jgi:hypothetical protein
MIGNFDEKIKLIIIGFVILNGVFFAAAVIDNAIIPKRI